MATPHESDKDEEMGDKKRQCLSLSQKVPVYAENGSSSSRVPDAEVIDLTDEPCDPGPFQIHIHDSGVLCFCAPGSVRLSNEIYAREVDVKGPHWVHARCQPSPSELAKEHLNALPLGDVIRLFGGPVVRDPAEESAVDSGPVLQSVGNSTGWAVATSTSTENGSANKNTSHQPVKTLALQPVRGVQLWPDVMNKRFGDHKFRFHCDGPCQGSEDLKDYLLCNQCYHFQHMECMLYGEEGDNGGPVCNVCYMEFMHRHSEIVKWQKQRLETVVKEATKYLCDPHLADQKTLRGWMVKMLTSICKAVSSEFLYGLILDVCTAHHP